ncbi:MAG TPA: hypothetical protein VNV43_11450 [Candidatus Acidoferrales bacterium]|nr:hypothetical protein [Candidatus Acidoferrales bacterium]
MTVTLKNQNPSLVGTARCAVSAAFSGATSVVGPHTAHVPPALRGR